MFMKAILHNREDDLHFLLKCLIEELQDDSILKSVEMIVMSNLTPEQRKKAEAYFQALKNANKEAKQEIQDKKRQVRKFYLVPEDSKFAQG